MNTFKQYLELSDQLLGIASKQDLAECARLLSINLAHYEIKYGALPLAETLEALNAEVPNDSQLKMLEKGMENLVGLLGSLMQGQDTESRLKN